MPNQDTDFRTAIGKLFSDTYVEYKTAQKSHFSKGMAFILDHVMQGLGAQSKAEIPLKLGQQVASKAVSKLIAHVPLAGPFLSWGYGVVLDKLVEQLQKELADRVTDLKDVPTIAANVQADYNTLAKVEEAIQRLKKDIPELKSAYQSYQKKLQASAQELHPNSDPTKYIKELFLTWHAVYGASEQVIVDIVGVESYFATLTKLVDVVSKNFVRVHSTELQDGVIMMLEGKA